MFTSDVRCSVLVRIPTTDVKVTGSNPYKLHIMKIHFKTFCFGIYFQKLILNRLTTSEFMIPFKLIKFVKSEQSKIALLVLPIQY